MTIANISLDLFAFSVVGTLLAGIAIGWELAIHDHRKARAALSNHQDQIETQFDEFYEAAAEDPQRAWIDVGKRSVLNRLEAFLREVRS